MKLPGRGSVTIVFLLEEAWFLDRSKGFGESLWLHLLLFKCPQFKIINNQSDNLSYLEVAYSAIFQWKCLVFWLVTWHIHFSVHFRFYAMLCYAKSLQSCLTLCYPIDGSPPGSPVLGILQARTLEWVAISFSNLTQSSGSLMMVGKNILENWHYLPELSIYITCVPTILFSSKCPIKMCSATDMHRCAHGSITYI